MVMSKRLSLIILAWSCCLSSIGQVNFCSDFNAQFFQFAGSATLLADDVVRLTSETNSDFGGIWSFNTIDFNNDFSISAELYFGTLDGSGADGIAFVIQPLSNNEGLSGGGIGFQGITPSLAVEMDTWFNSGMDPTSSDHMAIISDGNNSNIDAHSEFVSPIDLPNIEDGLWHSFALNWTASSQAITVDFDGTQMINTNIDVSNLIFDGGNDLFWGFTAATGGAINLHQVKILEYCFTPSNCDDVLPPDGLPNQQFCGVAVYGDLETSAADVLYYDTPTDGSPIDENTALVDGQTVYISQVINGCESEDRLSIAVEVATILQPDLEPIEVCELADGMAYLDSNDLFIAAGIQNTNEAAIYLSFNEASQEINALNITNDLLISSDVQLFLRLETAFCFTIQAVNVLKTNCDPIIPQGFSPNDDGVNDFFNISHLYNKHLNHKLKIYNRFGNLVFEGNNDKTWPGTFNSSGNKVPVGTYFYVLQLNDNLNRIYRGWVYVNY